ncbi:MAG: aldo/keto reductase [Methanosphaera sp.]|nr:aldo/keto reductase [Methanosphaera sp.]
MIQQRKILKKNTTVPALGFGAMRLPKSGGKIDRIKATELLNKAIDEGVNYIDTAYLYHNGESEKFLKTILDKRRDEILLSTKLPVWLVNKNEHLYELLDTQKQRLGVDVIDYYYLHSLNYEAYVDLRDKCDLHSFLDEIRQKDAKNIGFSYHGNFDGFKKIIDDYDWDMCLLQYNYVDENTQAGRQGVEYAYSKNVSVFIMEPLKGGLLVDNIPPRVKEVMDEENITDTPSKWGLKWVLNHKEATCVLSGMNALEQLEENIKTTNETEPNTITQEELETYKTVSKVYDEVIEIPCTQCEYCMSCPWGVDIPACFNVYNNKKLYGNVSLQYYMLSGLTGGKAHYASKCRNCGACVSKCPQHIDIPSELAKVSGLLEFPGYGTIIKLASKVGKPLYKLYLNR